jgi:hypothetical protein
MNVKKARGADGGDVSRYTSRPAQAVTVSSLMMRRPNTDSAPNMPVTLQRNQLLIHYVVTSPVHTVTIRCYGTR